MEAIGTVVMAWLVADLMSGFFHWWEDRYARPEWPLVGPLVATPNQQHHAQPTAFCAGGYWHRNYTTIVPAAVLAVLAVAWTAPGWVVLACACLSQANEVHAMAHRRVGPIVRTLQESGVLCSAAHHAKHHRPPFDRRYCVLSGLCNPVLDRLRVWGRLEWLVERVSGIQARG